MSAAPDLTAEMTRALSRAALYRGLDLGDERQGLALLRPLFSAEAVDLCFDAALEEARAKAAQNGRLNAAAGGLPETVGYGMWLLAAAVLVGLPDHAQAAVPVVAETSSWLANVVPVVAGLAFLLWLSRVVVLARPEVVARPDERDDASRWNGEGR